MARRRAAASAAVALLLLIYRFGRHLEYRAVTDQADCERWRTALRTASLAGSLSILEPSPWAPRLPSSPAASSVAPRTAARAEQRAEPAATARAIPTHSSGPLQAWSPADHALEAERALALARRRGPQAATPATTPHAELRAASLREYAELHAQIRAGTAPKRYIVVKPCCQLCNRVRVLVSAIALGVLTKRAVLMNFEEDYYGSFKGLFASPLEISPAGIPAGPTRVLPWLDVMEKFVCETPHEWSEDTVVVQGAPGFLHAIWLNPSLRGEFEAKFGPTDDGLFADIFWALTPPQPHILRQAQSFVAKVASEGGGGGGGENGTFVVALHVRNGRDFRSKKLTDAEWGRLADCAGALPTARARNLGRVRYVVATESEGGQTLARNALGADMVRVFAPALPKGKEGSVSQEGAERSLAELLVLSMCDATVLTPMSSFSEVAAALARRPGLYFHFDRSRKFHYESAVEAVAGCLVPWTYEMPGSMNLHLLLDKASCGAEVRRRDATMWSHPTGLRFLDGTVAFPDALAEKVSTY
jgi:hypothetical protein